MKKLIFFIIGLLGFSAQASEPTKQFPPVPKWQPSFSVTVDEVLERVVYYSNNGKDIVMFKNGTAVIVPDNLTDKEVKAYALKTLSEILNYHPDMNPLNMDDGNILIQYNHPACNVVINEFANKHFELIKKNHLDALATSEVLNTPLGPNKFDEFSMKALYGRTFMFMDAQAPEIVKIYRHALNNSINSD
ncbi:MAG: hypothetical protein GY793_11980 [Proteobacteria bacterium]|nr:hypothetical protein [Pseudomonadota bacterium]